MHDSRYGCKNFLGDPYGDGGEENPSIIHTMAGDFQGFKCDVNEPKPVVTFIFFSVYIVLTSWVIMSLFIGVISMGMFEAFEAMKAESKNSRCVPHPHMYTCRFTIHSQLWRRWQILRIVYSRKNKMRSLFAVKASVHFFK